MQIVHLLIPDKLTLSAVIVLGAVATATASAATLMVINQYKAKGPLTDTFVMMTVALSLLKFEIGGVHIGFSSLLACMMLGTVFCNVCDVSEELMDGADRWTAPILVLFFVISGAELDLSVFTDIAVLAIGVMYIISRSLGKYYGAGISARDEHITKKRMGTTAE